VTSGQRFRKPKINKKTGLKVRNRFVEYIGSVWQQICLCVKILIVTVVLFVLSQAVELISLYINVNSGGLETISGEIVLWCFWGGMVFFLLLPILIPICLIISLIKIGEPINILLTVAATVIAVVSFFNVMFYIRNDVFKFKPEPDTARCVVYNRAKGEALRKFGLNLSQSKNNKDLAFTHQWLEQNLTGITPAFTNGKFVLNSNLLNKKLSQITDDTVVTFESNIPYDKDNIGGPNDISTWWHYGRGSLMVFGDGHVEFVKTADFNNLHWQL
jgi:hypothetical protein